HTRFERTGRAADLDRAINLGEQALAATPTDHSDRPMYLYNLGIALHDRFERTGRAADLDRAISVGEQALAGTPADHPNRAARLSNLGLALQARFERTGGAADLDRASDLFEEAVAATHPITRALFEEGMEVLRRASGTGDGTMLDEAVGLLQRTLHAA